MSKYDGHTPGPWKMGKELGAKSGEWLISMDCGSLGRGMAIAETRPGSGEEDANARLIADGPKNLAKLQEAKALLTEFRDYLTEAINVEETGPWTRNKDRRIELIQADIARLDAFVGGLE